MSEPANAGPRRDPRPRSGRGKRPKFVPALQFRFLTRFYDPLLERFFRDRERKQRLVDLGRPRARELVLDLGGGTGTLASLLLDTEPACRVVVVDIDLAMLLQARRKVAAGRAALLAASADALPLATGSFDRAFSSLFFHHLLPAAKRRALAELHRGLRSGASFFLLDFGRPRDPLMWLLSWLGRLFDGWANTRENFDGRLLALIASAGFTAPEELGRERSPFGLLVYYHSRAGGSSGRDAARVDAARVEVRR